MGDRTRFCGRNPDCPGHGKRGRGHLTVAARYGPNKARRWLRCSAGPARLSERKGTPLFDARLPAGTAAPVLGHAAEGVGTRRTARRTGVRRGTVTRYTRPAGGHAERLRDELVALSPDNG